MTAIHLLLLAVLAQAPAVRAAGAEEAATMTGKPEVEVRFQPSIAGAGLKVAYTVTNRSGAPIFVFDRLWNERRKSLDPQWAYVEISGRAAVLKRGMELMPRGLLAEEPPVPYGREVAPGGTVKGSFHLSLPLKPNAAYGDFRDAGPLRAVTIESLELRVGWCPKPDAETLGPDAAPVKLEGESLWLLPYYTLEPLQKLAGSPVQRVKLAGRAPLLR